MLGQLRAHSATIIGLKPVASSSLCRPYSTVDDQPDEETTPIWGFCFPKLTRTREARLSGKQRLVSRSRRVYAVGAPSPNEFVGCIWMKHNVTCVLGNPNVLDQNRDGEWACDIQSPTCVRQRVGELALPTNARGYNVY